MKQEQELESQEALRSQAIEGQKLIDEKIPEWKDNELAKKEAESMMTYAKGLGFTQEELSQIYDGRLILIKRRLVTQQGKRPEDQTERSSGKNF